MKATLTFDLPEESAEHQQAVSAGAAFAALWDIDRELFRPARKHGYGDSELDRLLEDEKVARAIELLEEKFQRILDDHALRGLL